MNTVAKVKHNKSFSVFDFLYMFVICIYMGQSTPETSRMVGDLSGNPIPLLIPMVLTVMLWSRYRVKLFNGNLGVVLLIYGIWMTCSLIKYRPVTASLLSYHFFMIYALVVAYVQVQAYGYRFLSLYERIMVLFAKVGLIMYGMGILIPGVASLYSLFPDTYVGHNIMYIFNWNAHVLEGNFRNSGIAWEPGRYAIMVVLAIYCNLCRKGLNFRNNSNLLWLLVALFSTFSTTGFMSALVLFASFYIRKFDLKNIIVLIVVGLPVVWGIWQLDFIGNKLETKYDEAQDVSRLYDKFDWHSRNSDTNEYLGSIDRLDAIPFEWMNILSDPLLGYGRDNKNSFFYKNLTTNYVLANGLLKILSSYGILLGLGWFVMLYMSSCRLAVESKYKSKWALFVSMCLCAVSYEVLSIPIFTAFWLYGLFYPKKKSIDKHSHTFKLPVVCV